MKKYRYFGGFLNTQEKWLNKVSAKGYRLVRAGKLSYQFARSDVAYQYFVEFVGDMPRQGCADYKAFLEGMDADVFYKNINLSYEAYKIRYRPWAKKGGRIATTNTTFDKELLIVGMKKDAHPAPLHTSSKDRICYYRRLAKMWLYVSAVFLILGTSLHPFAGCLFSLPCLLPAALYGNEIRKCQKEGKLYEG